MDEPRTAAAVWLGVAIERAVADLRRDGAHTTADDLKRAWAARAEVAEPDHIHRPCLGCPECERLLAFVSGSEVAEPGDADVLRRTARDMRAYADDWDKVALHHPATMALHWAKVLDGEAARAEEAEPGDGPLHPLAVEPHDIAVGDQPGYCHVHGYFRCPVPAATAGREPLDALRGALERAREALESATDLGIYPKNGGPGLTERTEFQNGWNAALIEHAEKSDAFWDAYLAALDTPSPGAS